MQSREPILLNEISHDDFKAFAKKAMERPGAYKKGFTILLCLSGFLLFGGIGFALTVALLDKTFSYLIQIGWALLACFSILIVAHELFHGIAYKLVGAKNVYFGAVLKKFVFYAGSDMEKFNGFKYRFIALFPFVCILLLGTTFILLYPQYLFFSLTILFVHTLFCSGDFALLNYIHQYDLKQIYTYDIRRDRKTYFYLYLYPFCCFSLAF